MCFITDFLNVCLVNHGVVSYWYEKENIMYLMINLIHNDRLMTSPAKPVNIPHMEHPTKFDIRLRKVYESHQPKPQIQHGCPAYKK